MNNLQSSTSIPKQQIPVAEKVRGGHLLNLVNENDPLLNIPSEPYNFKNHSGLETEQLVLDLGYTMRYNIGMGLSAVQCGIPKQVFVMETGGDIPFAIFNPQILFTDKEVEREEGCLSFPKLVLKVKRPEVTKCRFQDWHGEFITREFFGLTARIVMHEVDHLKGIVFQDKCSRLRLELAYRKRNKNV